MRDQKLREALLDTQVPDERGARERSRQLVHAAYRAKPPALQPRRRRVERRRVLQLAVAVGLIVAVVSPAGAAVRDWVGDTVDSGHEPARPALTELPAPGALLVDSARGPWIVHEDGSKRLLGAYAQSTWSPRGLFVAATAPGQILALDPEGEVRWTLTHYGSVSDPAWSPDGYRVAYLNSGTLRVVGGDGTGDRAVERPVAPVTPAWRPGPHHVIAFADRSGSVRAVDTDSGASVFATGPGPLPTELAWSTDGSRLLVVERGRIRVLDRGGEPLWSQAAAPGREFGPAALTIDGDRVAAVLGTRADPRRSELLLLGPGGASTSLFSGPGRFSGVLPSPDGRVLLLAWESADQWLFLDLDNPQRVTAVAGISAQFDPGTTSPPPFPELAGWCCPAQS